MISGPTFLVSSEIVLGRRAVAQGGLGGFDAH